MLRVNIKNIRHHTSNLIHRVSAEVNGEEIWFESSDVELLPNPEAFTSSLLPPAQLAGLGIRIESTLDQRWLENYPEIMQTFYKWHSRPPIRLRHKGPHNSTAGGSLTAATFSGGADSFYTALHYPDQIDLLILVIGFDINLENEFLISHAIQSVQAMAEKINAKPVVIRTNLRQSKVMRKGNWFYAHGGPLAALAALVPDLGKLIISSSYHRSVENICGSHPDLDHLWGIGNTEIEHYGIDAHRSDKIERIMHDPVTQTHLRVCMARGSEDINCRKCVKCLFTMAVLDEYGLLQKIESIAVDNATFRKRMKDIYLAPLYPLDNFKNFIERYPQGKNTEDIRKAYQQCIDERKDYKPSKRWLKEATKPLKYFIRRQFQ